MKRFLVVFALVVFALFAVSCVDQEEDGGDQTAAPIISIPGGVLPYSGSYVTLRCATRDAKIYYTLDGSNPSTGTLYTNSVQINKASTLRAIAKMDGLTDSEEATASYTIYSSPLADFALSMKIGWNLGNTMDGHSSGNPSETAWQGTVTTQALMNGLKESGFGLVRIPVTWLNKIGPAPDYIIDADWLNRVGEIAGYVRDAGMKAMINLHHDGADSSRWLSVRRDALQTPKKEEINEKYIAVWAQIAEKFKNEDYYLMFEAFNELHDGNWGYTSSGTMHGGVNVITTDQDIQNQYARVNELNKIFVETVRATGSKNADRYLVLPCLVTRPSMANELELPQDTAQNRLIVTVHFYDPYEFSGSGTQKVWGQNAIRGHWGNEANVRRQFDNLKTWFTSQGIPIILGEYGAVHIVGQERFRKYYMEYVTKYAVDSGIIPVYWDNNGFHTNQTNTSSNPSEKFGLIDRTTGKARTGTNTTHADVLAVMMKAAYDDYSYHEIEVPSP